ncbi:MAG TPA: trypsin-like serine protease [Chthoniobacter sp.]|nr:trypsin-like serine protease [Chthoniobacter sp.]
MQFSLPKTLFLSAMAAVALSPLSQAVTIRDDTADSAYIALGADSAYQAAGFFDDAFGGTLVADPYGLDQFVITSAHLVEQGRIVPGTTTFTVGGNSYGIASVVISPGYNGTTLMNDLAIVRLTTSVTNVTPVPYYTGSAEAGKTITMIGYGYTGTGSTGEQIGTGGTRRGANNVIDAINASTLGSLPSTSYAFDFDQPPSTPGTSFNIGSSVPLTLEGMIASGDSGGGDFAVIGGTLYLVGLHSYDSSADGNSNASYSDIGGSTRVSLFSSFIAQTIPEPASMGLFLGGVALLGSLRRRHKGRA